MTTNKRSSAFEAIMSAPRNKNFGYVSTSMYSFAIKTIQKLYLKKVKISHQSYSKMQTATFS